MDYKDIKKLIDDMGNSNLDSLEIEFPEGIKISMTKNTGKKVVIAPREPHIIEGSAPMTPPALREDRGTALVDVKNLPNFELGEKITVSSTLRAYDKYGNVVDVEISPANTDVELKISSSSKVVPIQVVPSGKVIYNKGISNFIINSNEKTTVTIYGESSALSNIEYIPVYIDVEGLSEDTQFKVDLEKPNGVKYMDTNSAIIDVKLSNDVSNVELQDIAISQINLGSNYGVTPVDQDSVSVKLKGVSDIVKNITASDIKVYVDLKGLGVGIHDVDIIVTGNDPRVEYLSSTLKIKVQIYEK